MGLFGPSKHEIWSQIARDIGGDYIESGFWKKGALRYQHSAWEIVLDTFTENNSEGNAYSVYTRMRVPFIPLNDFTFKLQRNNFFNGLTKLFGAQDIEVGDAFFDQQFVIKSNQPDKVIQLLTDPTLKALIQQQPHIYLAITDRDGFWKNELPAGTSELYFRCGGVIKETERLKALFDLFCYTVSALTVIGVADSTAPNVTLK